MKKIFKSHNKNFFSVLIIIELLFTSKSFSQPTTPGWFYQPLPVPTNTQIYDLRFFDENTGLIATNNPKYILRTTNGGYNWYIVLSNQPAGEFDIIDSSAVYARAMTASAYGMLLRSFGRGATWDSLPAANCWTFNGISFVNRDTGWIGGTANGLPFVWRTTNGGLNWTVQSDDTGYGKLFFLKQKVNGHYIGWSMNYYQLYKTTNSGLNWTQIQSSLFVSRIFFKNQFTGYISSADNFLITTNGGLNWTAYPLPTGNFIFTRVISNFKFVNNDTVYGDGGDRYFGNQKWREIIWVSTNGGVNWGFQQPDTSINRVFDGIDFANKDTGWSSWIRTNDGGGPIIITGINNYITTKPELFSLEQNYPNPFNSSTKINFSLPTAALVSLTLYDISGKEIITIFDNQFFTTGSYFTTIDLSKSNLSSGVYYYRITASDLQQKLLFSQTKKLVFIK